MSRRARALGFGAAALVCAALAAGLASGYRSDVAAQYGALRAVVVAAEPLPEGRAVRPGVAERALELRRIPDRFVPPDAIAAPAAAVGLVPEAAIPAGSYVLASQLAEPRPAKAARPPGAGPGRSPVEIAVSGGGAIDHGPRRGPTRVDVIVTTEQGPGPGRGRTYVAAKRVRLLDLRSAEGDLDSGPGPNPAGWIATLALTRDEALSLIQAESFARQLRVIAR